MVCFSIACCNIFNIFVYIKVIVRLTLPFLLKILRITYWLISLLLYNARPGNKSKFLILKRTREEAKLTRIAHLKVMSKHK